MVEKLGRHLLTQQSDWVNMTSLGTFQWKRHSITSWYSCHTFTTHMKIYNWASEEAGFAVAGHMHVHVPGQPTPSQSTWLDQRVSSWPKLANQLASPRNFQLESWEPESVKWPRGAEPERRDQARAGIHAATNRSQVQAEVLGGQKRHRKAKKKSKFGGKDRETEVI